MTDQQKRWDVFISHASEDKGAVAEPLANLLGSAGLDVWLDKHQLRVGDSLREKIDEGLALCSCGVVIFSHAFFAKRWPRNELNGLFALADAGTRIIPVWHEVTAADVAAFSPIAADRFAADTRSGLRQVASSIIDAVDAASLAPANTRPNLCRRLIKTIDRGNVDEVIEFLDLHHEILTEAFGGYHPIAATRVGEYEGVSVQFAISELLLSADRTQWHMLLLRSLRPAIIGGTTILDEAAAAARDAKRLRTSVRRNLRGAQERFADINPTFFTTILIGRREQMSTEQRQALERLAGTVQQTSIRTYDMLADVAERLTHFSQC
jgi:hypothetical protein